MGRVVSTQSTFFFFFFFFILDECLDALLLLNLEGGALLGQSSGPLVNRTAGALAHGGNNLVLAGVERLLLRELGLKGEVAAVAAGGLGEDGLAVAKGRGIRGHNHHDELASGNLVGHSVGQGDGELGSLGAAGGRDGQVGNVGGGRGAVGARVDLLADVDRIGVSLLEQLGELLNAGDLADNVADGGERAAVQQTADLGAAAADADVGNDLDKLLERLAHKGDAGRALKVRLGGNGRAGQSQAAVRAGRHQGNKGEQKKHLHYRSICPH